MANPNRKLGDASKMIGWNQDEVASDSKLFLADLIQKIKTGKRVSLTGSLVKSLDRYNELPKKTVEGVPSDEVDDE